MIALPSIKQEQKVRKLNHAGFHRFPLLEFVTRQVAVRASWSIPERERRAVVARIKQQELGLLLSMQLLRSKNFGSEG
jgi:hypothetical protein